MIKEETSKEVSNYHFEIQILRSDHYNFNLVEYLILLNPIKTAIATIRY